MFKGKDRQTVQTLIDNQTIKLEDMKRPTAALDAIVTTIKSEEHFWALRDSSLHPRRSHNFSCITTQSTPHPPQFPWSNSFIGCQVRAITTVLNTALTAKKPLEDISLDFRSTSIGPNMPLPHDILHNRTFLHPGRPSQPVNVERV